MTSAKPAAELAARRRLAERLRALRVDAGLSTTQLARRLGWSQAKVSRIETATHGVAPGDVRTWAAALDVPAAQVEHLMEQAWTVSIEVRSFRRELSAGYASGQAEAGQREAQATLLRSLQHLVVPALFQIRPYAVALFERARPIAQDSEQAADVRLARQRILDDQTRRFEWVVTEAALWWRPADWVVQVEQIPRRSRRNHPLERRLTGTAPGRPGADLLPLLHHPRRPNGGCGQPRCDSVQ